jgi:hypothetical protein
MTLFNHTYPIAASRQTTAGTWLLQLSAWMHHLPGALSARRTRARELRELYNCSDRELWDMGLSRSDFLAIEDGIYKRD